MRVFIALDISEELRQMIAEEVKGWKRRLPELSWTTPEQWHLTLAFLGEVAPPRVERIRTELEKFSHERFSLAIGETGVFPSWESPRVFWAGVNCPETLQNFYDTLWGMLEKEGFPREERDFHPHLTLARIKHSLTTKEKETLRSFSLRTLEESVATFSFYRSELHPAGARYTKLATYPFKGKENG
ncbi:RNA 2',3'-cyclic phosphodiesterase [Thermospira aquatica]|uniref:RNA 2',3'-cyclic phosphodiesterase n=1 Tax=Thermospira aquatica TaxID=2828656 RepID=A0AAX3BCY4_9SPIR|nr:RNA 2',3'-cyclic phosphodiesterase [Thermospira aquatica]URA10084.1 RNA 2',3'-cyclic phosphodiesterase [Thermospira aquatica]